MQHKALEHFVTAQNSGSTYARALDELRAGRKTSHWMWFVFPQLAGLGRSAMARAYAIASLAQAGDYLAHETLGPRLVECTEAALTHTDRSAEAIFGGIDAMKLRSSMTLFARADPDQPRFGAVLDRFYGGEADPHTEALLA